MATKTKPKPKAKPKAKPKKGTTKKPTSKKTSPAKTGRPTKYKVEYGQRVIDFMAKGYSKEATAAHLGIAKDTLYAWDKKHPAFSDAIKEGEIQSLLWWENCGMLGMVGNRPGFNASIWIFNMKNRHGWSDRVNQDIKGSIEHSGSINLGGKTDEELKKIINE